MNQRRKRPVDFSDVRSKITIQFFMESILGATPKSGNGYTRYNVCPNCGPSSDLSVKVHIKDGDDRWKCFACMKRGDVIEAAAYNWRMSLTDAAIELAGADAEIIEQARPALPKKKKAPERNYALIAEMVKVMNKHFCQVSDPVLAYLKGRGIPDHVCYEACDRGLMGTLHPNPEKAKGELLDLFGKDKLVESGFWKEGSKSPAMCFRPLLFFSKDLDAVEVRVAGKSRPEDVKSIRYGVVKPWVWLGDPNRILMTEGCIDMLTAVTRGTKRSIIALPGANNWQPDWFSKFPGRDVMDALDDDDTGQYASANIKKHLEELGISKWSKYALKENCKDLNEELQLDLGIVSEDQLKSERAADAIKSKEMAEARSRKIASN